LLTITGSTKLLPIIGHPVSGVFSPPAFNAYFAGHGIDAVMFGLDLTPDGIDDFWRVVRSSANMLGCSITYPHKQKAYLAVDSMTARAARLGALNTIRRETDGRLTGDATDGCAMEAAIREAGVDIRGKSAFVLGAGGGAGLAIVDRLCEAGIGRLVLRETEDARRANLMAMLERHWPHVPVVDGLESADILVNATTLGKHPDEPSPFPPGLIAAAEICCDVITAATDTPFVGAARQAGKRAVDGNAMGAKQIEVQLGFLGLAPQGQT
jgi:shikimate dehydrogenase